MLSNLTFNRYFIHYSRHEKPYIDLWVTPFIHSLYTLSCFFIHSGTSQTISSKEEKPSHKSWKERKKLCRNRLKRKERSWTGPSTLPPLSIACGCACTPSWANCALTRGLLCVKAPDRHCFQPLQPTGPCCSSKRGISWSGRYRVIPFYHFVTSKISFYSRFSLFAAISFLHLHLSPLGLVPPARLCAKVVHHSR